MAEFVEVLGIKSRMCKYYDDCSDGCPLDNTNFCALSEESLSKGDFKEAEKIMLEWAKEHPAPTYPTWEEWLVEQGILQFYYVGGTGKYVYTMSDLGCSPIQDDTAEKLGIQPEGE